MGGIRPMLRVTVASKSESTTRGMIKFAPTEFQDVETCVFVLMMWGTWFSFSD
jgi:hypothetical protein